MEPPRNLLQRSRYQGLWYLPDHQLYEKEGRAKGKETTLIKRARHALRGERVI